MSIFNDIKNKSSSTVKNFTSQFDSVISTRSSARYASGARTLLKVNGKLCGFAFGVSWRITTQVTEIQTIDDYLPTELAPQRITVEGTISSLHIPGQGPGSTLWQSDQLNFLFQQYITLEVRDISTDQVLFKSDKVMITSRQEDIKVDQLSSIQLSWRAIGFMDEKTPERADNHDQESNDPGTGPRNPVSRLVGGVSGTIGGIASKVNSIKKLF